MRKLAVLHAGYHSRIGLQLVRLSNKGEITYPNFADSGC